jgi:hypothetical protein
MDRPWGPMKVRAYLERRAPGKDWLAAPIINWRKSVKTPHARSGQARRQLLHRGMY